MPTIDVGGSTLYYEDEGSGATVLFVHGMCGDAQVWADQAAVLRDRFRCVRYDRRGYSRSGTDTRPVSEAAHADDAAGLIERLRLDPCLVVGSSAGAAIALDVVVRHAHLLRGALISEPPVFDLLPDHGAAMQAEVAAAIGPSLRAGRTAEAVDAFMSLVCPGLWRRLDDAHKDRYRANGKAGFADLRSPKAVVARADLERIAIPVLLVRGGDSFDTLRELTALLAHTIPRATLVDLPGSGHVTYAEQPEAFAAALRAFAEEIDAGSR